MVWQNGHKSTCCLKALTFISYGGPYTAEGCEGCDHNQNSWEGTGHCPPSNMFKFQRDEWESTSKSSVWVILMGRCLLAWTEVNIHSFTILTRTLIIIESKKRWFHLSKNSQLQLTFVRTVKKNKGITNRDIIWKWRFSMHVCFTSLHTI